MSERPTVVLLHGLGRTARSLAGLRRDLEARGFNTWARTYPSRRLPIDKLAALVAGWIRDEVPAGPLFAVTHSLGGVLIRHMNGLLPFAGVVMLAPPNHGSRVAAVLENRRTFRWLYGPALRNLGTPCTWPQPPGPFAVIAGTRALSIASPPSWIIRGFRLIPPDEPHDGAVTVAETRLEGMIDFAEVHASHTWLMNHPHTRELVARFIEEQTFGEMRKLPAPPDDETA